MINKNKERNLQTYCGPNAIKEYLNPQYHLTPLVEIPIELNPFRSYGVRIFAKLMSMLPLANVKSIPAFNMLEQLDKNHQLDTISHLIENSSGNTVSSLGIIGKAFGIPHTATIISDETSTSKVQLIRFFGTEITVNTEPQCPDPNDPNAGIIKAKLQGQQPGWLNPGQYENPDNPKSHTLITGPQIWQQLNGDLSIFAAGLGTTGTMFGTARYLKQKDPNTKTVGVTRLPYDSVSGVRTSNLLTEIKFPWRSLVDHLEEIGTVDSYAKSLQLARHGLLAGPSSGLALSGLLKYLEMLQQTNQLDKLRNKSGEINAVFICPDSPLPYISEYFKYLDESYFPPIKNKDLLKDTAPNPIPIDLGDLVELVEPVLLPNNAYNRLYPYSVNDLKRMISHNQEIKLHENIQIIDVRSTAEYELAHLPKSINIPHIDFIRNVGHISDSFHDQQIITVCQWGIKSTLDAEVLRSLGLTSFGISGGISRWQENNLPLIKPQTCSIKYD